MTGGYRIELAWDQVPDDWQTYASALFGLANANSRDWVGYHDRTRGGRRLAAFDGERLTGVLFVGAGALTKAFVESALGAAHSPEARYRLLAGRASGVQEGPGPLVCSCFCVGANTIAKAIASGCASVEFVGETLKAGTNCGSCRSEIRMMLEEQIHEQSSQQRAPQTV